MPIARLRVKVAFTATLVATRRREAFAPGELIVVVDGAASPSEERFIRLNGIRPSRGVECRYSLSAEEFREKTETAGPPQ